MIEFVQATKDEILRVDPQSQQCEPIALSFGLEPFEKDLIPLDGRAIAIRESGRCIGAYGLIDLWPGCARLWALFSEGLVKDHPAALALHAKRDMKRADALGLWRIEAACDADHPTGARFLQWLGFEREGLMRRYSPTGKDQYLYARVTYEL